MALCNMRELIERLRIQHERWLSASGTSNGQRQDSQTIIQLLDAIREMREALQFYGCVDNWDTTYYEQEDGVAFYGDIADRIDKEDVEIVKSGEFGSAGKRARAVLAKLGLGEE